MRAAILTEYNEPLVVEEVSTPAIGPSAALVGTLTCDRGCPVSLTTPDLMFVPPRSMPR